ncbi:MULTISPECIES: GNAT family N-acetyltransferase [Bacillaceae]|uniref:GNAT family N-acetyltransferase n=1 Tax=Evansella alkalicola TaxID=745819 RepID=A0ABS6JWD3_9BACI|nr:MULTISPECIES: GNAT family N-acetyltransferase [Bacillaceae]MBU9722886.1 GNAT family N-acetyltransferase [Bacillus alkalicola]
MREITIRQAREEDILQVAELIAKLNKEKEHHIGYCGEDRDEIINTLETEFKDHLFENSFVIAERDEKMVGVLGFDGDLENQHAEIWGPFFSEAGWGKYVIHMWTKLQKLIPSEIDTISLFPQKNNENCAQFANGIGFEKQSEQTILVVRQEDVDKVPSDRGTEINEFYEEVRALHDATFPGTYYNGDEIMGRINDLRKVFTLQEQGKLVGYIYVEAEPQFGEGSIEFFAVHEAYRGKGKGKELLQIGLKWLFSFEELDKITLCVNAGNDKAIRLYEHVGFQKKHELVHYIKKCHRR